MEASVPTVFGSKEINAVFSLEKDRASFYGLCSQRPKLRDMRYAQKPLIMYLNEPFGPVVLKLYHMYKEHSRD